MVALYPLGAGGAVHRRGLKGQADETADAAGIGVAKIWQYQPICIVAVQPNLAPALRRVIGSVSQAHAMQVRLNLLHGEHLHQRGAAVVLRM